MLKFIIVAVALLAAQSGATIPDEDWGYVSVRPQANMFWWLMGATNPARQSLPLVVWLQGGPGASSTGFGNFEEIGPLDVNQKPRPTNWVQSANVLFIDNPVGTGYSYVTNQNALTRNVTQIATDLLTLMKAVVQKYPEFQTLPFWIFCESYGGKMTAAFGVTLQQAILNKTITMNFKGVALGDSWISPTDYTNTWGPFLRATSLVDEKQEGQINQVAASIVTACKNGQWSYATQLWDSEESIVEETTDGVNFYNILQRGDGAAKSAVASRKLEPLERLRKNHLDVHSNDDLDALMNGPIRQKLKIIPSSVTWGGQSGDVFDAQSADFMRDVIPSVDQLLSYGLAVHVYNGQLDLICDTLGTEAWMQKLMWPGMPQFYQAAKTPLYATGSVSPGAFLKTYKNLSFWWIMQAGHMVPTDNGPMALKMLQLIINGK